MQIALSVLWHPNIHSKNTSRCRLSKKNKLKLNDKLSFLLSFVSSPKEPNNSSFPNLKEFIIAYQQTHIKSLKPKN